MRRLLPIFLLLSCDSTSSSPPTSPPPHEWASFPDGSRITYRYEHTLPTRMFVTEETWTLETRDDAKLTLRVDSVTDGNADPSYSHLLALEDPRDREFSAGGKTTSMVASKSVTCERMVRKDSAGGITVERYVCPSLSRWPVMEVESEEDSHGKARMRTRIRIDSWNESAKAGGREFACIVFEIEKWQNGRRIERTREWRSLEIPGHLARQETECESPGESVRMTVISFDVAEKK